MTEISQPMRSETCPACADLVEICRQLKAELQGIRQLVIEQKTDAEKSPEGLVGKVELKRRCQMLSYSSQHGRLGRSICRFCGKGYTIEPALRNHYRRQHPVEVSDLPASTFEPK